MAPDGTEYKVLHWTVKTKITLRGNKHSYERVCAMPEDERQIGYGLLGDAKLLCMRQMDTSAYKDSDTNSSDSTQDDDSGIPRF